MTKRNVAICSTRILLIAALTGVSVAESSCEKTTPQQDLFDSATVCDLGDATAAIKAGADVNASDPATKQTPLMVAAVNGCTDIVNVLLKVGANANATIVTPPVVAGVTVPSEVGESAVYEATMRPGRPDVVRPLAASGADVNAPEADGTHPIDMAVSYGEFETVRALVEAGADINAREGVLTPLSIALIGLKEGDQGGINGNAEDRSKIVDYLRAKGAQESVNP